MNKKYFIIYKITCNVTNNFYIGMHSTDNLNDGYLGSGNLIKESVKLYGRKNHSFEILEFCDSIEELKQREKIIIDETLLQNPLCLNIALGGTGGWYNEEHKQKNLKAFSEGGNKALQEKFKDPKFYKSFSDKMKKNWENVEYREKALKGLDWTGRAHSDETKQKMSKSSKGKNIGEKNSQFGTCWVYNEQLKECKKIKKEELNSYIEKNWNKGRKMKFD